MVENVSEKEILWVIDCWKYTFSLKTLGGGYVRCFLVFSNDCLIEIETNHVANIPPFKRGSYSNDIISNIFWGIIDTIYHEIKGYSDKLNIDIYKENKIKLKDFLEFISKRKVKYNIKKITYYWQLKHVKIKSEGRISLSKEDIEIKIEILEERKKSFHAYFPERSIYDKTLLIIQSLIPSDRLNIS